MALSSPQPGLAQRLRELRERHWPELRLTQAQLATAFGDVAPATVSSWENPAAAKPPPPERLLTYARFFGTHRSIEGAEPQVLPADGFSAGEKAACQALAEELLALRNQAVRAVSGPETTAQRSWHFGDVGPLTIVCAQLPEDIAGTFASPANPNYTVLQSFADLDALIELHGHVRAENPRMQVFFKASHTVVPDDLSGHVVLLGGIAWNRVTRRLSEMTSLPVKQIADPAIKTGEIFIAGLDKNERTFTPQWHDDSKTALREDVGLLARAPNPLNSNRTLVICNGVHSRGVLGSVRSLTDAQLRDSNEQYIARNFPHSDSYAILMRVPIIGDQAMTPDFNADGSVLYKWP